MGRYRARDLLRPPGLISLLRVPLALVFPWLVHRAWIALGVLALAAVSDVADGWVARKYGHATPTGAVLDAVTDKLFVFSVVITLLVVEKISWDGILMLAARDIGELPLVLWWLLSHHKRKAKAEDPKANVPGKLATVLQFAAVGASLLHAGVARGLLFAAGGAGVVAAISYWVRELEA